MSAGRAGSVQHCAMAGLPSGAIVTEEAVQGQGQRTECLFLSCARNIGKEQPSGKSSCFPAVLHGSESLDDL